MSCGCGSPPPVTGWQMIPELKLAIEQPLTTTPPQPAPQPGRAPAERRRWPWWAWIVVALLVLSAVRSSSS